VNNSIKIHEKQYASLGLNAQRQYPNEALIAFIGSQFFHLPKEKRTDIKILELGCGSGGNLWALAKEGFSTYGIDGSDTALKLAHEHLVKKWGITNVNLLQATFDHLPFKDDFFDVIVDVVSLQCLNIEDSKNALKEINRCLKSKGKFFSYRLSDASVMYLSGDGNYIDEATLDNINDPLPLNNSGPNSFWSPLLVKKMYAEAQLDLMSIERRSRTYRNSLWYVEYLEITAEKSLLDKE
jgi:SAM-dependent methyltransferase